MVNQKIITAKDNYRQLDEYLIENKIKSLFLVCDDSLSFLEVGKYFDLLEKRLPIKIVKFSNFKPNPIYESVEEGVRLFQQEECDSIIAVGGGSAIDVAKCVKLYLNLSPKVLFIEQPPIPNHVKLLAMPTTAGTGSEATRYAVVYYKGEKQSISDNSCIPSTVLMDSSTLKTLPLYQKKATMMDALCHAIESFWSVNSTDISKTYSKEAIRLVLENKNSYIINEDTGNANMLEAAYLAGKAINITQTTAGHAMSYKLTSLYNIAHGHAVALCVNAIWPYMVEHIENCIDDRGTEYLKTVFDEIAVAMGSKTIKEAILKYQNILNEFELAVPDIQSEQDYKVLTTSVNPVRMKNNPVALDAEAINELYHQVLGKDVR